MFLVIVYKRTLVSGTPLNLINTYHLVRAHAIVCTYLGFALQNGVKVFLNLNLKFSYQSNPLLISTGSIRTEKKIQLELKKKFSYKLTEKKFQLVYN